MELEEQEVVMEEVEEIVGVIIVGKEQLDFHGIYLVLLLRISMKLGWIQSRIIIMELRC